MCRSLLPIILLTTVTLSSSNVLPILSINKLDTEHILDDQDSDNTFNNKHNIENPNIFYKVFIETPKDDTQKESQILRSKYTGNDNLDTKILNRKIENEDSEDGFRKEQWHNYPRQLDRLNRNFNIHKELDKILLDTKDLGKLKDAMEDSRDDYNQYINTDIGSLDSDDIDGPLLVLKIRLAHLTDNINNADPNSFVYTDLVPLESATDNKQHNVREDDVLNANDIESFIKVKRKAKPRSHDIKMIEDSTNDRKTVRKRIFSLWSRLQSLSHRGHELHHRRHLYALYGLPEDGGGTLTAETRATLMRPPGSPLRWG